jgi:hypothetical protein
MGAVSDPRRARLVVVGVGLVEAPVIFFTGMHQPYDAWRVPRAFVSIHRLRHRIRGFPVGDWIMDSGAFSTIALHGGFPDPPRLYAAHVRHWSHNGRMLAAVSQDYMCEPFMLAKTGGTVADHQRLTIERYDALRDCDLAGAYLMPVIQGYDPAEYASHIDQYGDRLADGAWAGVGSVCKRNSRPSDVLAVLEAIRAERPDLRLHGFGLKTTALRDAHVRELLHSADSMAWSFHARRNGRNPNSWHEALRFHDGIVPEPPE